MQSLCNHFLGTKKEVLSWRRPTFALLLSSALVGLTAVFGMGTGVTPPLMPPRQYLFFKKLFNSSVNVSISTS